MNTPSIDLADAAQLDPRGSLRPAEPCAIVIFGASGDLSRRKLIPALYELASQHCLARHFAIVGFARTPMSDDAFRNMAADALRESSGGSAMDDGKLREFLQWFTYLPGDYHDAAAFQKLNGRLQGLDQQHHLHGNRLYYLATPPEV